MYLNLLQVYTTVVLQVYTTVVLQVYTTVVLQVYTTVALHLISVITGKQQTTHKYIVCVSYALECVTSYMYAVYPTHTTLTSSMCELGWLAAQYTASAHNGTLVERAADTKRVEGTNSHITNHVQKARSDSLLC